MLKDISNNSVLTLKERECRNKRKPHQSQKSRVSIYGTTVIYIYIFMFIYIMKQCMCLFQNGVFYKENVTLS